MEVFDKDGKLIGEFIAAQKKEVSSGETSCSGCLIAILKVVLIIVLVIILYAIIKALSYMLVWTYKGIKWLFKYIGIGCLWLLKKIGIGCLLLLKLLGRCVWWLIRFPFYLILKKKRPKF